MPFSHLGLDPSLQRALVDLGYARPTPIQDQAIPAILTGRDLVGCAQTGTGKTAAFVLPTLQRLLAHPRGRTRALILCPTRELALQVEEDVRDLGRHTPLRWAAVYGGVGMHAQEKALRAGTDIIVATPGRLLDHMNRGTAKFPHLEVLVLDEADRMLDMGFLPDLRRILRGLPKARQSLLFSATMPPEILSMAREVLRDPLQVSVSSSTSTPAGITHAAYPVNQRQKADLLLTLLERNPAPSVLVFTRTKHRAERLARSIERAGMRTARLHGNRSQSQRVQALESFRHGRVQILVATDIAARGLDIDDISHVINFDVPATPEDYVHRIGRTARMNATGDAFTLVAPDEERMFRQIEQRLGRPLPRVTLPDFPYDRPTIATDRRGRLLLGAPKTRTGLNIWPAGFGRRRR